MKRVVLGLAAALLLTSSAAYAQRCYMSCYTDANGQQSCFWQCYR